MEAQYVPTYDVFRADSTFFVKKLPKISKIGRKSARFARFCQKVGEKLAEIVEPRGRQSERPLTDPIRRADVRHIGAPIDGKDHASPVDNLWIRLWISYPQSRRLQRSGRGKG
jgi:hypothetical protein